MDINELAEQINEAVAEGLNNAAELFLEDIQGHVPIRTGKLQGSYAVTQIATPENPQAEVSSNLFYSERFYPANMNFGKRPRLGGSRPPLFGSPENEVKAEEVAAEEIVKVLETRFNEG